MPFFEEIKQIYLVGNDQDINEKLKASVKLFTDFWSYDINLVIKTDYLDLILQNITEKTLYITTDSGLEKLENPGVFSIMRRNAKDSKILHVYNEFSPDRLNKNEQKNVFGFVDLKGDFNLQLQRIFRKLNT